MPVEAGHDTACVRWRELATARVAQAGAAAADCARPNEVVLSVRQLTHVYKRRGLARLGATPRPSIESLDLELHLAERTGELLRQGGVEVVGDDAERPLEADAGLDRDGEQVEGVCVQSLFCRWQINSCSRQLNGSSSYACIPMPNPLSIQSM